MFKIFIGWCRHCYFSKSDDPNVLWIVLRNRWFGLDLNSPAIMFRIRLITSHVESNIYGGYLALNPLAYNMDARSSTGHERATVQSLEGCCQMMTTMCNRNLDWKRALGFWGPLAELAPQPHDLVHTSQINGQKPFPTRSDASRTMKIQRLS